MKAPYEEDGWRVVQDPYLEQVEWRCRAFVFEFRPCDGGKWRIANQREVELYLHHTPKRAAMLEDLFLNP